MIGHRFMRTKFLRPHMNEMKWKRSYAIKKQKKRNYNKKTKYTLAHTKHNAKSSFIYIDCIWLVAVARCSRTFLRSMYNWLTMLTMIADHFNLKLILNRSTFVATLNWCSGGSIIYILTMFSCSSCCHRQRNEEFNKKNAILTFSTKTKHERSRERLSVNGAYKFAYYLHIISTLLLLLRHVRVTVFFIDYVLIACGNSFTVSLILIMNCVWTEGSADTSNYI